jgi:hypothetical protein
MKKNIMAPCGDRCDSCPRFIATDRGDRDELARVALLWHRLGWRDTVVSPEEMACGGCTVDSPCRYGINRCALERRIPHCGDCEEFPCPKIDDSFRRTAEYERICRARCSEEEFSLLKEAFFEKSENLVGRK